MNKNFKRLAALAAAMLVYVSAFASPSAFPDNFNVVNIMDFTAPSDMLNKTVHNWNNWTLTTILPSPTLSSTIAVDPITPIGISDDKANKVLKLRRTATSGSNERPYYRIKADGKEAALMGIVYVGMRLYAETVSGNFTVSLRSASSTTPGNYIAMTQFNANRTIRNEIQGSSPTQKDNAYPLGEWFDFMMEVNTEARTYDAYVNGVKVNSAPMAFYFAAAPGAENVGMVDIDIKKEATGTPTWYADDIVVWQDYEAELISRAAMISDTDLSDESLNAVTANLKALPDDLGDGYSVEWQSDNHTALSDDGQVTQRGFTQQAKLTAKIIKDANTAYYQNACCYKSFDLTILPLPGLSDQEILDSIRDFYLTDEFISDEPLSEITHDLNTLPTSGPDGVSFVWTSSDGAVTDTGAVTRPDSSQPDAAVILTVTMTKGDASETKEFSLIVKRMLSVQEMLEMARAAVTYETLSAESQDQLRNNLNLISMGLFDIPITWDSDNTSVISNSGVVTRAGSNITVNLTADFTLNGESLQKVFTFIVLISPSAKLTEDAAAIALGDLIGLTASFNLPLVGNIHDSSIIWSSNKSAIAISGSKAIVTRPEYVDGDATVSLTATLKNEDVTLTQGFTAVVSKLPSDESLVQEVYDYLTFGKISSEQSTEVTRNLALQKSFESGVSCVWTSNNPSVLSNDGIVINPPVGSSDVTVRLTVVITKRNATLTKSFDITIKAFNSADELLLKARINLGFAALSSEHILEVSENLNLPTAWLYGTSITWSSDNSTVIEVRGNDGIVLRPPYGNGYGIATLRAIISYSGKTVEKEFSVKVKEADEYFTAFKHDNEALNLGGFPNTDEGTWTTPDPSSFDLKVVNDPEATSNKVAMLGRPSSYTTNGAYYYIYTNPISAGYGGLLTASGRFFMESENQRFFWIEFRGPNGSQIPIWFYADGGVGCQIMVNGGDATLRNPTFKFKKDEWVNFTVEINTVLKYYNVYVNGECVTEDGSMLYNGNPYSTEYGVPYRYFAEPERSTNLNGYRISLEIGSKPTDSKVYFDDLQLKKLLTPDSLLLEACAEFEREFLSGTNIYAVTEDLSFPALISDKISISYTSSHPAIISNTGKVTRPDEDTDVILTACFSLSGVELKRPFKLRVLNRFILDISDIEAASSDLFAIINELKEQNNLNNIVNNISFKTVGETGSIISYQSSRPEIISASGTVNRQSQDETVIITVTATRNGEQVSENLTFIVKANQTPPSKGSSGGGTVYGGSTISKSGINMNDVFNPKITFSDVTKDHWAYAAIMDFADMGIVIGETADLFAPDKPLTREVFAKIAAGTFGLKLKDTLVSFTDVNESEWYAEYIKILASNNIINGKDDGSFGVGEYITRQDMTVIIYRIITMLGRSLPEIREYNGFSDEADIGGYAKEAITALFKAGIINGMGENNFAPKASSTRAQAVYMLYKIIK